MNLTLLESPQGLYVKGAGITGRGEPVSGRWLPRLIWIALGIAVVLALVEYFHAHYR